MQANDVSADAPTAGTAQVAAMARKVDLSCSSCGYGVFCRAAPARCPMCGAGAGWVEPPAWTTRRTELHGRLAG